MAKYSRKALVRLVADNIDSSDIADKLAGFLIDNNRVSELDSILRDVMELRASEKGIVEIEVSSAFELDKSTEESIKNKVNQIYPKSEKVIMHKKINKDLIGGADIKFANANLDLTIKNKLNKLREAIA
jgi:ATP synthase F1 delta subunit